MAIDVLKFNELKKQTTAIKASSGFNTLQSQYTSLNASNCLATLCYYNAKCLGCQLSCGPWYVASVTGAWSIPGLCTSPSGGFAVCDTSSCMNAGANCNWTVPAGISYIRFQLWGAGAASGAMCCCGFVPPGGSGAYASVVIPAVTGATYSICSGCAYWGCLIYGSGPCAGMYTNGLGSGCASYVTGPGLNNLCAEGGEANPYNWMMRGVGCCSLYNGYCTFFPQGAMTAQYDTGTYCQCICTDGICGASGGPDYCIPFMSSSKNGYGTSTYFNPSCTALLNCSIGMVYTMRGWFSSVYNTINNYTCFCMPPIPNLTTTGMSFTSTSGTCQGYCCYTATGYFGCCNTVTGGISIPATGGFPAHAMGGSAACGSSGRMGMVCVQYF